MFHRIAVVQLWGINSVRIDSQLRTPLKDVGKKNGKMAGDRTDSKGKNNGSAYDGGKDEEGNLGACDVFVAPDGEVTQVSMHHAS